ncbi:MAG: hypothetical protein SXV54_18470, partial [Chloroflexota bacterium]|nr:hypothetical protein [Chloroflexota bacterium]
MLRQLLRVSLVLLGVLTFVVTLSLILTIPDRSVLAAPDSILYVAPNGDCGAGVPDCYANVQAAVDVAVPGDEIRVSAGIYTHTNTYGNLVQSVYISKTITIQGGYTTTNWTTPDPLTYRATLDALGQGRVIYITGDVSPTIRGLYITGGRAVELGSGLEDRVGGGVCVITASARIEENVIISNTALFGGGLYLSQSEAVIE